MASRFQSRGWRRCRSFLRGIRITILLILLVVVASGFYLNQVGLPGFLKQRLLTTLHRRGVDLQFTRLRWRYYRGLVAENVRFGTANAPTNAPHFLAREVELKLDHGALRHFEFTIDALVLHSGRFVWPLVETNQPARELSVDNIQTHVRFLPNDQWELDHFSAMFAGAKMELAGSLTNATALRNWKIFHGPAEAQPAQLPERIRELADTLDQIKFFDIPDLKLTLRGDGRDIRTFNGILTTSTLGAHTPWGKLTNSYLVVQLLAPDSTNRQTRVAFSLHADDASSRWGGTKRIQLEGQAVEDSFETNLMNCHLELAADQFTTEWAEATNVQFTATWAHSLTNAIPLAGHGELHLQDVHTVWGQAEELRLDTRLRTPLANAPPQADAGWAWWADLEPYVMDWDCHLGKARAQEFEAAEVSCGGSWRSPELTITNLHWELYGGQLGVQAVLNVATRSFTFSGSSDIDALKVPFLPADIRNLLGQYSWEKPPVLHGQGGMTLPAWTNRHPDWLAEVLPTSWASGDFSVGPTAFRGVPVLSARSQVIFTNLTWNLPDLVIRRPEGQLQGSLEADGRTLDFHANLHSDIDLKAVRPLLDADTQSAMDLLILTEPPVIDAELWGHGTDYKTLGMKGHLVMTNFTFRGETASFVESDLRYTNLFIQCDHPQLKRGTGYAKADSVGVDITERRLYLTNGTGSMEPMPFIHTLGSDITKIMEPYQFLQPPTVSANGVIPLAGDVPADIHFQVDGGPFHWMKFNVAHISGGVHWVGDHLSLSNVQSEFYGGRLSATADFDFNRGEGADFTFDTFATSVSLGLLIKDLFDPSNHLEGTVTGHLSITNANSAELKSWFGKGQVNLRDGLLWDIPIFGVFSKVLDGISPGLGESRASEGAASFIITNSVIRSDDLVIRATALRMKYRGTVDFDGNTDAIVEADLLRDTPLVGPLVSTVLLPLDKMFEWKITGSLTQPKPQLMWPAKLFTMPFHLLLHPVTTLKEMGPGSASGTNLPPTQIFPQTGP